MHRIAEEIDLFSGSSGFSLVISSAGDHYAGELRIIIDIIAGQIITDSKYCENEGDGFQSSNFFHFVSTVLD